MTQCKVCGRSAREGRDTCSVECGVEAWAATWAVTPDEKREASWRLARRRAEARKEPFNVVPMPDRVEREWRMFLAANPRVKAHWETMQSETRDS